MAVVEPYAPCPCGSGQKFKWCCQKGEAAAGRAERLLRNGQINAAINALEDGLRSEPTNIWLRTLKAVYLLRAERPEEAKAAVLQVLAKNPKHAGAQLLMTRLVLETEGPIAGAGQLQQTLTTLPAEERRGLSGLVGMVGAYLAESGEYPAALRHLWLARTFGGERTEEALASRLSMLEGNPSVSVWQKNRDELAPPPSTLVGDVRERYAEALGWAEEGLWSSAGAVFETLTSDPVAGPLAERNLGLCRLWLADHGGAVAALRRYIQTLGPTAEAVDLEVLCQQIAPPHHDELVDQVQLVWPVRDRDALVKALSLERTISPENLTPTPEDDPESPAVDVFVMLDRPVLDEAPPDLKIEDVPQIVGRLVVGKDEVALQSFDDGRLDRLIERFTTFAGSSIPPAHPKTRVVERIARSQLALIREWLLPDRVSDELSRRLMVDQNRYLFHDIWLNEPLPALQGRTPRQAAQDGNAQVPLRASLFQIEQSVESQHAGLDLSGLRSLLGIDPEPAVDPATTDLATLHLARLALVSTDAIDDEPLAILYHRARRYSLTIALDHAARALVNRREAWSRLKIEVVSLFTDLASLAASRSNVREAFDWIQRGREADTPATRSRNAPAWDIFEIQLKARVAPPEVWVPEIAVLLSRYSTDQSASQTILLNLVDMGLVRLVNNPNRPGEILVDSQPLQTLLSEYGPRVTTASGGLGVSAAKPEIWTPGTGSGGPGGLWTPGSGSGGGPAAPPASGGGGKNLIIPGR